MESIRNESLWSRRLRLAGDKAPTFPSPKLPSSRMPTFLSCLPRGPWCCVVLRGAPSSRPPGGRPVHPDCRTERAGAPTGCGTYLGLGTKLGSEGAAERCHPRGQCPSLPDSGCPEHPATPPCPLVCLSVPRTQFGAGMGRPGISPGQGSQRGGGGHRPQVPWPQAPRCRTMTGGLCSLSERRLAARSWHRLA